jgi:hypothetical protein
MKRGVELTQVATARLLRYLIVRLGAALTCRDNS